MEIHLKYIPPVIVDQQHQVTGDLADCWDREEGVKWAKSGLPKESRHRRADQGHHATMWDVTQSRRWQTTGRVGGQIKQQLRMQLQLYCYPGTHQFRDILTQQSKSSVIFIEQPFDCSRSKLV